MKTFNIGIIELGYISDKYINNLKKYDIVNVISCASRGLGKAEKKATELMHPEKKS